MPRALPSGIRRPNAGSMICVWKQGQDIEWHLEKYPEPDRRSQSGIAGLPAG
jgi:hypothetical protein